MVVGAHASGRQRPPDGGGREQGFVVSGSCLLGLPDQVGELAHGERCVLAQHVELLDDVGQRGM